MLEKNKIKPPTITSGTLTLKLNLHNYIKYANPFPLKDYWSRELQQLIEGFLVKLLYIFMSICGHKRLYYFISLFYFISYFLLVLYIKTDTITNLCKFLSLTPTNDGLGKLKKKIKTSIKENICGKATF